MPFARCWFSDANRPPSLLVWLCLAPGKKPPILLRPSLSWLGCRVSPPFSECPINPPVLSLQRQDPVQGYVQISAGDLAASGPGRELPLQGGLQGLPPVPSRDRDRDRQRGAASNPPPLRFAPPPLRHMREPSCCFPLSLKRSKPFQNQQLLHKEEGHLAGAGGGKWIKKS